MAKIYIMKSFSSRQKKWEHFKLKARKWIFYMSILANIYFLYKLGHLDQIIHFVTTWINKYY